MKKAKLRGKDLKKLGFPEGRALGIALNVMQKSFKRTSKLEKLEILSALLAEPEKYEDNTVLGKIVKELKNKKVSKSEIPLKETGKNYKTYGESYIEAGAIDQMERAMRLPITVAGSLMADAHQGYGLPIGGVLAAKNAIIPYGVGMDIGCRMCLTVYNIPVKYIEQEKAEYKRILQNETRFGTAEFKNLIDNELFERSEFRDIKFLNSLKDKAFRQVGTSGSGNHFVEIGIVKIIDPENEFEIEPGEYFGILSHSGSRGMGAEIARHYTKLAMETCRLPREAKHLAWFDLDSNEGEEYWKAMNLAGDYSAVNHMQIHSRLSKAIGEKAIMKVENHHNFAWKEKLGDGREVIVHRKGATPAGKGDLGVIPGSMTLPAFIVRGKGERDSLNSASHGAGRLMSRTKAKQNFTQKDLRQVLEKYRVELIGGGLDEVPMAYKDIHKVMKFQKDLVETIGTFHPKIVRME